MPRITFRAAKFCRRRRRASMRPGRNAPDNLSEQMARIEGKLGFNEAGAKCPG